MLEVEDKYVEFYAYYLILSPFINMIFFILITYMMIIIRKQKRLK